MSLTDRIAKSYIKLAFKYEPKETKAHKVEVLLKKIREATGVSKGVAEAIADAVVRGRDLKALALQKGWPVTDGELEGPSGTLDITKL